MLHDDVMKLTFVYKKNSRILEFPDIMSVKKAVQDADLGFLYYISALTLNEQFRKLIGLHRKEFNIPPEGFNYSEKGKVPFFNILNEPNEPDRSIFRKGWGMLSIYDWKKLKGIHIGDVFEKIFPYISLFNRVPILLETHVSWYPNFDVEEGENKFFKEMLKPQHKSLAEEPERIRYHSNNLLDQYEDDLLSYFYYDYPRLAVQINIDSPLSLNSFTRYLKSNWKDIEYYLSKMESYNDKSRWKEFYISERDMQIVEMHRFEGKTFTEIGNSFNDRENSHLYEDNVKTAYHRAINKIDELVIPEA